jgi:hypothetical protein
MMGVEIEQRHRDAAHNLAKESPYQAERLVAHDMQQGRLDHIRHVQAFALFEGEHLRYHNDLVDACCDLLSAMDISAVEDSEDRTKEEWAAIGSARVHAEDRIRAIIEVLNPSDIEQESTA